MDDKDKIGPFARKLSNIGWEIVASGGTATFIESFGVRVTNVETLTGLRPIFGHRVVTLHPKILGGILADPNNPEHQADMAEYEIEPFGLVVGGLYEFIADPSTERIDVGGTAILRGAIKNHAHVGVVSNKSQYDAVIQELQITGVLSAKTRHNLAIEALTALLLDNAEVLAWLKRQVPQA